jgi:hypothetical protein
MVSEHALPSAPKSADRIDGAMMAGGDMASGSAVDAGGASVRDLVYSGRQRKSGDGGNGRVTAVTICMWC